MNAKEIAGGLTKAQRKAIAYYSMADIHPKDDAKLLSPVNQGWSSKTIDWLLDAKLIECGTMGWHVLSELGLAVAKELEART